MKNVGYVLTLTVFSLGGYARADLTFGPREKVPVVSSSGQNEVGLTVFAPPDGEIEVMVFSRSGGSGYHDLWQSTRALPDGQWSRPVLLGRETSSAYYEDIPYITPDGLTLLVDDGLWFGDVPMRPRGLGRGDIWMSTRETVNDDFGALENLGETINSPYYEGGAFLSVDELTLFFDSMRPGGVGGTDLWMASRDGPELPWGEPVNLGEVVNTGFSEMHPAVSRDGLRLFFSSDRSGQHDIWTSTRDRREDPWGAPVKLDENVNHPSYMEVSPRLSPDGSTLYFSANLSSTPLVLSWDIYAAPILSDSEPPAPRFVRGDANADGNLDVADGVFILGFLFGGEGAPPCLSALDSNGDGGRDVTDAIFILNFLFGGGLAPPAPFPECGPAASSETVDCAAFTACE